MVSALAGFLFGGWLPPVKVSREPSRGRMSYCDSASDVMQGYFHCVLFTVTRPPDSRVEDEDPASLCMERQVIVSGVAIFANHILPQGSRITVENL